MKLRAELPETNGVAEAAVRGLRAAGFGPGDIELFSSRPVELKPGVLDRPSRMSLFAVLGAIINGGAATAFMFYTQLDYPLVTGGMPLTSGWATGVITFELTMAGAVAGTVIGMLVEGRFFRQPADGPKDMREDTVYISVSCSESSSEKAKNCLAQNGARLVEQWG